MLQYCVGIPLVVHPFFIRPGIVASLVKVAYVSFRIRTHIRAPEMEPARAVIRTVDAKNSGFFYRVSVESRQKNEYR